MAWTRLTPPMFSHFLVRPRRRRRRSIATTTASCLLALVMMIAMWSGVAEGSSGCKVDSCTRQFQQEAMASGVGVKRGPSTTFCIILRKYSDCLRSTARSCRGHLAYHSTITLVQNWNGEFNCSYVGGASAGGATPSPPLRDRPRNPDYHSPNLDGGKVEDPSTYSNEKTVTSSSADRTTSLEPTARVYVRPDKPPNSLPITGTSVVMESSTFCTYQRRPEMTHCSFYGDPHLVTFNGDFQTCKVAGAWPLIDNAYLAVSVTNEAVVPGSSATATTKITIIIKGGSDCAPERTYEAAVDSVPASFVDGSQWGGPLPPGSSGLPTSAFEHLVPVRIVEKEPGRHVEIHARHLGATLIVRQVGRYLTFAAKLPREIALQGAGREGLQLCVKGCPASERIDVATVLLGSGHGRHPSMPSSGRFYRSQTSESPSALVKGMTRDAALALCREYNLTDYYLDSCMFDLMTTGDPSFSLAASRAQADYFSLLPDAASRLANRTWALGTSSSSSSSSTAPRVPSSASSSTARSLLLVGEAHGPGRPSGIAVCLLVVWSLMSLWNPLR